MIGAIHKFSLIDYPGKISCVLFTQGCNFRCPYCHNPELISLSAKNSISLDKIFSFLENRKGLLDGVVITGGEPTLHCEMGKIVKKIKKLGYEVKLDTNGSNSERLKELLEEGVDYVAMDIKAPFTKYEKIIRSNIDIKEIAKSMEIIMNSSIPYEFRTTIVKSLLSFDDILEIAQIIEGARMYVLQKFVPTKTLDPLFMRKSTYSMKELVKLKKRIEEFVDVCLIR